MKRAFLASVLATSTILTGCAGGTPDCGDSDTLDIIHDGITAEVEKYAAQTNRGTAEEFLTIAETYEVSNIRTLSYDEDIDSYQCDARITYVYFDRERRMDFKYRVDTDQSDGNVLIEYQSKMLDPILGYAIGF